MKHLNSMIAIAALAGLAGTAQADTVAGWTFERPVNYGTPTSTPYAADVGDGSLSIGHQQSGTTYYTANGPGVGNGSYGSVRTSNWTVGDYYQFSTSATGFQDLSVSWDQTSESGPLNWVLQYSTDGSSFTTASSYQVLENGTNVLSGWTSAGAPNQAYRFTADLSTIDALEGAAAVYFRLVDNGTTATVWNSPNGSGTVGNSGYSWVDNFTVTGTVTPVPLPAGIWLLSSALLGLGGTLRRRRACSVQSRVSVRRYSSGADPAREAPQSITAFPRRTD